MKRILLAFVLAACSSSAPAPTAPPTPTEPAPPPSEPTADPSAGSGSAAPNDKPNDKPADPAPGIGENCGPNDSCAAGTECVKYYGIAGPRGPEFKTCEIRCSGKGGTCPAGKNCVTIADGPGSVCR